MSAFAFLPFPSALVAGRKLRLENDFSEGPIAVAFEPDGALFVLSEIFYNAYRYREPESNDLHGHYLTHFAPGLGAATLVPLAALPAQTYEGLAVVGDGLLVTHSAGRSWGIDRKGALLRAFAVDDWGDKPRMYRENFAALVAKRPSGHLVVAIAEPKWNMTANVLAVSVDPNPPVAAGQPALRYLTSIDDMEPTDDEIPYVRFADGTPFSGRRRPKPTLRDAPGAPGYGTWLGGLAAVTDAITLVALYVSRYSKHSSFQLALVDDAGAFVGALDLDGDSPYVDHHLAVAADPRHGRAIVKTKGRLHVFDDRGRPLARVALDDAAKKPLAAFHLLGASPAGEILLWHKKQRTLLLVDATPDVAALPDALASAAAHYKAAHAAAKKAKKPVNARWIV